MLPEPRCTFGQAGRDQSPDRLQAPARQLWRKARRFDGIEALDELLVEELSLRENRRIKAALRMARLPVVKTLAGFDFYVPFEQTLSKSDLRGICRTRCASTNKEQNDSNT